MRQRQGAWLFVRNRVNGENVLMQVSSRGQARYIDFPAVTDQNWQLAVSGDFNGDGIGDLLWRHGKTGENYLFLLNADGRIQADADLMRVADLAWQPMASADVNRDGKDDILWFNTQTRELAVLMMDGLRLSQVVELPGALAANWTVKGLADVDNDGQPEVLGYQSQTGQVELWTLGNQGYAVQERVLPAVADTGWQIQQFRDQDGDGKADLLWRHSASGEWYQWQLSGNSLRRELSLAHLPREASSQLAGILPRHGGQPSQLLLRTSAGQWHSWSSDDRSNLAYVHTDHLGVPRLVTGSDQGIVWQGEMQPFGELNLKQDKLAMPLQLRYPGQYHDDETGLYYNGQRYYDPKLGRYTTPDPIGLAGGVNTYAYVEGDPVNKADPSGLMSSVDAVCLRDLQFCSEIMGQVVQNNGNIIAKITGDTCLAAKADADAEKIRSGGDWLTAAMFFGVAKVEVATGKFDYLFGRAASNAHNASRSNQLALEMKRLGVPDTAEGRQMLIDHLNLSASSKGNIVNSFSNSFGNFEVRESLFMGPSGKAANFQITFQVLEDGVRRLSTIIPRH